MTDWRKAGWLTVFASPLLIGAALAGSPGSNPNNTTLTVSGQGYVGQSADTFTVSAGSSMFSKYPSRAVRDNAAVVQRLRMALTRMGIEDRDIVTGQYQFAEGYDRHDQTRDRVKGYNVQQQLTIFVRDADQAGKVLDKLVEAGADSMSIHNRHYRYQTQVAPDVQSEAREAAVKDAQAKAKDYAAALGMRIIRVVKVQDQGVRMMGGPAPAAMGIAAERSTQIDNGEQAVVASVGVEFELAPKR